MTRLAAPPEPHGVGLQPETSATLCAREILAPACEHAVRRAYALLGAAVPLPPLGVGGEPQALASAATRGEVVLVLGSGLEMRSVLVTPRGVFLWVHFSIEF